MSHQFYPLKVSDVSRETEHAVVVTFAVPEDLRETFSFIQGQYLTLEQKIAEETVRRSYSICAGLDDQVLKVAI